jgi:NADPH:quinone reductase-like Zn-dependent oxidoreductase
MFTWLKHPSILGYDVAGEVVEVGKDVTRFQVRDRVVGFAVGTDGKVNDPAEGAFQEYVVLRPDLTSPIPSSLSYEAASVIPLGLSTAAAGLFQKDTLALHLPSLSPKPTGQTLIVWGGSTSVGCNAIQLGVAAGHEVFTTYSARARLSTTEARALFPI